MTKSVPDISDIIAQGGLPTNRNGGRIEEKTNDLRVYVYKVDGKTQHKIQQRIQWRSESDAGSEWKDLPVVKED